MFKNESIDQHIIWETLKASQYNGQSLLVELTRITYLIWYGTIIKHSFC